jgi:hypothetical protein
MPLPEEDEDMEAEEEAESRTEAANSIRFSSVVSNCRTSAESLEYENQVGTQDMCSIAFLCHL